MIAAGGIMDGAGIAACLLLGAGAAQLGTAFIACPESAADENYRAALLGDASGHTVITTAISGRPARCLANRFTAIGDEAGRGAVPAYPIAYDAAKAPCRRQSCWRDGIWGPLGRPGSPLARSLRAATLVAELQSEMEQALSRRRVYTASGESP